MLTVQESWPKLDEHPVLLDLQEYCEGTSCAGTTARIEEHIKECSECSEKIAGLVRASVMDEYQNSVAQGGGIRIDSCQAE